MKQKTSSRHMDTLMVLVLFGIFAVCILSVLLTGAQVYQRLSLRDQNSFDRRTAAQYISTKVRQAENPEQVWAESFEGHPALVVADDYDGETYLTRIYCYDGYIRELFASELYDMLPSDGESVLPAQKMEITDEDGVLHVTVTDTDGNAIPLILSLRGEGGMAS